MFRAIISPILRNTTLCLQLVVQCTDDAACRPAASSVHCTTSCKHSLVFLRMGEIIARNILSGLKLLVNCYCCIWLVVDIIMLHVILGCWTGILLCCRVLYHACEMFLTNYYYSQWLVKWKWRETTISIGASFTCIYGCDVRVRHWQESHVATITYEITH